MLLLEQSLAGLLAHGMIEKNDALMLARDVSIFETRLRSIQQAMGQKA